jgi:hypothetical protein
MAYTINDVGPEMVNGVLVELSDEEKQIIVDRWNTPEVDNRPYNEKRREAYGSWESQLDMMFHDQTTGSRTWLDHIEAVKEAHPK